MPLDSLHAVSLSNIWAVRMADSILAGYTPLHWKWHYEHGLLLKTILKVGIVCGNPRYEQFIHEWLDSFITPNGRIRSYHLRDFNLDQINPGNLLLAIFRQSGEERFGRAIELLHRQLLLQPRTITGNFWHKKIYPHQVWLDGIYMAQPFHAGYADLKGEPAIIDDVTRQIIQTNQKTRDPQTGLLYHGWDESRQQSWADPQTGCSPSFWGRGMGWYAMAIVDVLEFLPANHSDRGT